uniref:Uncharacterized protein n=1 Tax=Oryza punctata TaxID=4537 RepID=A0A0E0KF78_ORYPU
MGGGGLGIRSYWTMTDEGEIIGDAWRHLS